MKLVAVNPKKITEELDYNPYGQESINNLLEITNREEVLHHVADFAVKRVVFEFNLTHNRQCYKEYSVVLGKLNYLVQQVVHDFLKLCSKSIDTRHDHKLYDLFKCNIKPVEQSAIKLAMIKLFEQYALKVDLYTLAKEHRL